MEIVTKELIKNHRLIRRYADKLTPSNKELSKTIERMQRFQAAHFWFEEKVLFPKLKKSSLVSVHFLKGITQGHGGLKAMLNQLKKVKKSQKELLKNLVLQIRVPLDTVLRQEISVLYPLTEKILSKKVQKALSVEMFKRNKSVRVKTK